MDNVVPISKASQTKRRGKPNVEAARAELDAQPEVVPPPQALMLDASDERLSIRSLPISSIVPGPNPRVITDPERQKELTASVKVHGVLQPVLVRPLENGTYQLIAGWRRYEASRSAKRDTIPVVVASAEDQDAYAQSLIENVQREDLDPVDEARAYRVLLDTPKPDGSKIKQVDLADMIGKSAPYISNKLRLLALPEEILNKVSTGEITEGAAKAIASLPKPEQTRLAGETVRRKLTANEVEREARFSRERTERETADARALRDQVDAFADVIEAGRKAKVISKKATILVYGERIVGELAKRGIVVETFNRLEHHVKNGKITCDDQGILIDMSKEDEQRFVKTCLVPKHYNDVIDEERKIAEAEHAAQVNTLNEVRNAFVAVLRDTPEDGLTGLGQRFALYTLLAQPYAQTYNGDRNAKPVQDFLRRHDIEPAGNGYGIPLMLQVWPAIVKLPLGDVAYEIIAAGVIETVPNVYADGMRDTNSKHAELRKWFVDNHGLEETIVWGGHEPILFADEAEAAALEPHEFVPHPEWYAEAEQENAASDEPLSPEELKGFEPCLRCSEGGVEGATRDNHDMAMAELSAEGDVEVGAVPDDAVPESDTPSDPEPQDAPREETTSEVEEAEPVGA